MSSTSNEVLLRYDKLFNKTIQEYQDPITGLLPSYVTEEGVVGGRFKGHAWIRDNVYSVLVMWGLSLAYKRKGEGESDRQRGAELEKMIIKQMRSVLLCMLRQTDKVEKFKKTFRRDHALHAKYNMSSCGTVVGDYEWGHLQIDATSLFLLVLAQLTCSGLQIIFSLDEVSFIQNLIFYIEAAYKIPDYGIWERGDKSNLGQTELNSTSIGMAKAALEAMSGLDLFGSRGGGPSSVIYVLSDQVAQCNAKLVSLLPRESSSKEIDAGLLTIIGFPAFAVESEEIIAKTKDQIEEKLLGNYGCRRFLRDGYQTVKEDKSRLHYEAAELKIFENIECEWPLFLFFLLIDAIIRGDEVDINECKKKIDKILIKTGDVETVPELYYVPIEHVNDEYRSPHSQPRKPGHKVLHLWAQSMYILSGLLEEGLVNIGEIDPLNRRLSTAPRPDPLVQFVLLAEDDDLCRDLRKKDLPVQTFDDLEKDSNCSVCVLPGKMLSDAYAFLGVNRKMGLTGRALKKVGVLSTSMLYILKKKMYAFYPSFLDHEAFYLCHDNELLVDILHTDITYIKSNWRVMGCPIVTVPILRTMLSDTPKCPMTKLLLSLQGGYLAGVRVQLGYMSDFISTSCLLDLAFVDNFEDDLWTVEQINMLKRKSTLSIIQIEDDFEIRPKMTKNSPVTGAIRRSRAPPLGTTEAKLTKISTSPSFGRLQVAKGWASRRQSVETGYLLSTPGPMNNRRPSDTKKAFSLHMEGQKVDDLIKLLETSVNIFEQADILHYLFDKYGKNYDIRIGNQRCTVEMLLEELFGKVSYYKLWSLVRHSAGMLRKTVDEISQVATDLLVRQKTFSIGQPSKEIQITQPLPQPQFVQHIYDACGTDYSAFVLTQEILVYLAMFIRSEPKLFNEMLRLRIGLIQNVMTTELARAMHSSNEEGLEQLLELNPYELKSLLYHILNRQEFTIDHHQCNRDHPDTRQFSIVSHKKFLSMVQLKMDVKALGEDDRLEVEEGERQGQWRRRRRIDGALNRVPLQFYSYLWHILEQSEGISIGNQFLPRNPTVHEMTPGELKFAILVEGVLNSLPDPEYRQLVVEMLMVCALWVGLNPDQKLGVTIAIDDLISVANKLFLDDQRAHDGIAKQCCCSIPGMCRGHNSVCVYFYDSAPSGMYGTMSYLSQAIAQKLKEVLPSNQSCRIS